MIWLEDKFKTKGTWLIKVLKIRITSKKCNIMKCMSQYLRIMSLKMRWPWIWATFGIQTQPTNGTRTRIQSLREYTYSQWKERHSHLHGVDHVTSQALQRLTIQKQITEAYSNVSSIPGNEQTFTFSLSIMERFLQPTANLNAWLLQYQTGQHRLSNILKQEKRNCSTITKFLFAQTAGQHPAKPPD